MHQAKITSKGQVTIPADVRADLGLIPGSRLDFDKLPDGRWVIQRKTRDIRELRGILKYDGPPVSIEDMNKAVADAAVARYRRACP